MHKNKINNEGLDNFFSFVSKAVIIIPIFIVIISLFFKFNKPKIFLSSNSVCTGQACLTPTIKPTVQNNSFKFDLKGPIVCDSLSIQNRKILFKNKTTNYLLNGDCLYTWETSKLNGEKKCGLSNYVNMAENYLGFLNIDDIVNNNLVKDFIKDKDIDLANVVKSCKREEIKDKNIFSIPKQVLFESK